MPLQKTFSFTNNGNSANTNVFISNIPSSSSGVFTATIESANQIGTYAIITVAFTSPTVNYIKNYQFIPSGTNDLTTQGYAYLQTLPEFSGSTTV